MKNGKLMLLAGLMLLASLNSAPVSAQCGGLHRLEVVDLDMRPDPAFQGQPIREWVVTIRADGNGECATRIMVKDSDQIAGNALAWTLHPGSNEIHVPANPRYRMQGADHCFTVIADVQNSQRRIDEAEHICARMRPVSWTLAERATRPR